jgi:hypothetical protein
MRLAVVTASLLAALPTGAPIAAAGPQGVASAAPAPSAYRLIRSTSGSKGQTVGNTFSVVDPRTVFRVPDDRQILVHFEWDGPAGKHRMEGIWRNPDGRVSTVSEFDYEARGSRFGAYWTLALPDSAAIGTWRLEARIDGQPAGAHTFEILPGTGGGAGSSTASAPAAPARRALSAAEVYTRLQAATALVEKLDAGGRPGLVAAAAAVAPGYLATPFHVVEGAARLKVTSPTGQTTLVESLAAYDRKADWAILPVPGLTLTPLERPAAREVGVGSHLYTLNISPGGERTIVEAAVAGASSRSDAGERLVLSVPFGWRSAGAPLVDDYGMLVGIAGAVWAPGTAFYDTEGPSTGVAPSAVPMLIGGSALAVPIDRVVDDGKGPRPIADVGAAVSFIPMLGPSRAHVIRGTTAQGMKKTQTFFETIDPKATFSKARGSFAAILDLMPRDRIRDLPVSVSLWGLDGKLVAQSKPVNVKGDANRAVGIGFEIDPRGLPTAIYRLDVGAAGDVMWRTFVEVTP